MLDWVICLNEIGTRGHVWFKLIQSECSRTSTSKWQPLAVQFDHHCIMDWICILPEMSFSGSKYRRNSKALSQRAEMGLTVIYICWTNLLNNDNNIFNIMIKIVLLFFHRETLNLNSFLGKKKELCNSGFYNVPFTDHILSCCF